MAVGGPHPPAAARVPLGRWLPPNVGRGGVLCLGGGCRFWAELGVLGFRPFFWAEFDIMAYLPIILRLFNLAEIDRFPSFGISPCASFRASGARSARGAVRPGRILCSAVCRAEAGGQCLIVIETSSGSPDSAVANTDAHGARAIMRQVVVTGSTMPQFRVGGSRPGRIA